MSKVFNFRDLGGLETADGRHVKSGLFFRSGYLDKADDEDIAMLKSLHLTEVFDYRDRDEVSPECEEIYKMIGAKHLHYPNDITKGILYKLSTGGINRAFIKVKPQDVAEFYTYLPFNNEGYKAMVNALKNDETPFLQHCTAGKDRAGMGSALLLAILGVPYETIVEDYMKSLAIYREIRALIFDQIPKIFHKMLKDNYEPMFVVDKLYIDAVLTAIKEKYGTFENYLNKEYNLTKEDIEEIRNRYLE